MANQRLQSHPDGFGVSCGAAHRTRFLEKLFINVERLLHTDDVAIPFRPKQPDASRPVGRFWLRAGKTVRVRACGARTVADIRTNNPICGIVTLADTP
jgi:hypothetical protein